MAIGVGQQLEQEFAANPEARAAYQNMVQAQAFNTEWDRFCKTNKDAESLRYQMGEHLRDHAKSGETMQASFKRAYKAVKASEPKNDNEDRQKTIGAAWDRTYGGR
jgi:hypothetical protein